MSIEATVIDLSLRCVVQTGVNPENGRPILRNRNYGRVKPSSSIDDRYDIGVGLMGLQEHTLMAVQYAETNDLVDMG